MGSIDRLLPTLVVIVVLVGCTSTMSQPPAAWDGLEYRPGTQSGLLYVQPGTHFKAYRTVMLNPTVIDIDSRWDPDVGSIPVGQGVAPRRLSSGDVQRIKDTIANECRTILAKELTAGGYKVVERPVEDTVLVSPALTNLRMDGTSSGTMTLVMELRDVPTGKLLARLVDSSAGDLGYLQYPDSVTKNADFRRAIRAWGQGLRAGIDEISTQVPENEYARVEAGANAAG